MAEPAYKIEEFTASDGYRWRFRHYAARGTARARLVCIHGIQSHGGWYEHSCAEWAAASFDVTFLDRRGSGLNEEARGDCPSFRRLLDDIAEFLTVSPTKRERTFLLGISWGGKLATALQRRYPGLIGGLLLLCPGFFPQVGLPLRRRLGILWSRLWRPRKLYDIPLNDPELFTATPRWQEFLRNDPKAIRQATARFLLESARLDGYLRFVPKYVTLPVLMLLAERDRIINNARTRAYFDRFAASDKQITEYPGAHHTLEFEPNPDKFIGDVRAWLERHL